MDATFPNPMWGNGAFGCACTGFNGATFTLTRLTGAAVSCFCNGGWGGCTGGSAGNTSGTCAQVWNYHDDNWCPGAGLHLDICFALFCTNRFGSPAPVTCGALLELQLYAPISFPPGAFNLYDNAYWQMPGLSEGLDLNSFSFNLVYTGTFAPNTYFPCTGSDPSHFGTTPLGNTTVVKH